ncbi:MAG: CDP-alcohol phosphatidyltransferase family protein [Candidatus Pacebacteria bacterium]|jgi:CDP-diacylglycerol--glycerol-3-phosphate 3-phosphatidyltransferase|nr:CDP-alcohol phosphatidyltransferase family protein [Candidatus Paceibacterota bacterium]
MSHKLTITDRILAKTLLPLIPHWITPNYISWMRLCSVPFVGYFLWIADYSIALPLFFVSAFSDAVDGSLARTRDLVTHFGKMFDPLADKLLIATAAVILIPNYIGWSIVLTMVSIDLVLILSAYYRKHFYGTIVQAENTGKAKMVMQSIGIGSLLIYAISGVAIFLAIATYSFYLAIFFALLSLVVYRAV